MMKKQEYNRYSTKGWGGYHHTFGGAYFLGFIGATVYYIQQSATFGEGVVGVLKALVWPAFLVHKLFGL